jgi:peptidoglycan hydrolase-like protein with peptidoglycan-binding domain
LDQVLIRNKTPERRADATTVRHPILTVMKRFLCLLLAVGLSMIATASANDNVRAVQTKLKEGGFFFGEVDGAFSSELSAALTRFQIRRGLQVTGQLDEETSKALGAQPAVVSSGAAETTTKTTTTSEASGTPTADTWRRLRKSDEAFLTRLNAAEQRRPAAAATTPQATAAPMDDAPAADAEPADPQPAFARKDSGSATGRGSRSPGASELTLSTERLRDYVGAFVLAGLDPTVGAELEFFGDRVRYYDEGVVGRDAIRRSLQSYNAKWPQRRFWIDGDITAEPQSDGQVRVTFPLRYELRSGSDRSSGKIMKTLVLEPAGDDLQIVAVDETKAR